MTTADLIAKKLALIETCLNELRTLSQPEEIATNVRERRFVEHTLQIAIQAALDVASHIVASQKLGEPKTNRELFSILAQNSWLQKDQQIQLEQMAGFRNILVHGYADVNPVVVRDVVENHLDDLERFVASVRSKMP